MLDKLRSAVNSWPARILLGFVLLSFVAWGGHSALQGESDNNLMVSGKISVNAAAYETALRNEVQRLSMRIGRYLTPEEIKNFGLEQLVYNSLYRGLLLDNAAAAMKIGASDKNVAELLSRDRFFSGENGQFDLSNFNFYLQTLRMKREAFLDMFYVKAAKRDQITAALQDGLDAPDIFYRALALYQRQTRNVDYAVLQPAALSAAGEPDSAALEQWFKDNGAAFRTPEYRQISMISVTPQDIARPDSVSGAAVAAYYAAHKERYLESAEKRSFDLIRFTDKKAADAARAAIESAIKDGESAEQAFAAYGKRGIGKFERQQPIAQADLPALLGAEVFSLSQGEISSAINDLQGSVLIFLRKVIAAQPKAQAAAESQIRQAIARETAAAAMPDYRKKIEDARFEGADLKAVAARYHLPLRVITLDKEGKDRDGKNADFPQSAALLPNIFAAAENVDADPLNLRDGGYLWYNIDKVIAPRLPALAEVRAKATEAWKREEQRQQLDNRAADLARELNKGADFAVLAKKNNLVLQHLEKLPRSPVNEKLGQTTQAAVFAAVRGESGFNIGADEATRVVFRVNAIAEPQNAGRDMFSTAERENISGRLAMDFLGQYLAAQAQLTPIRTNMSVYNRLLQAQN